MHKDIIVTKYTFTIHPFAQQNPKTPFALNTKYYYTAELICLISISVFFFDTNM